MCSKQIFFTIFIFLYFFTCQLNGGHVIMYNYTLVHSCMHVHIQEGGDREIIVLLTKQKYLYNHLRVTEQKRLISEGDSFL